MATNNIFKFIYAGLLGSAMCLGLPACTDDHFDIDTSGDVGSNATKTLWEQIQSEKELSNFATILEKTPLFKDEAHQVRKEDGTPFTYKDVLSGTQTLTVFAPTNSAFDDAALNHMLDVLQTDPYSAYLQMVGNHIVRYRHPATGTGIEKVVTINGKRAVFDREAKVFKDIPIQKANVEAINGTLHIMGEVLPFNFNLYELIKMDSRFTKMREWVVEHDTIYFNESLSATGGSDPDGNPIYVDSVYSSINVILWNNYSEPNSDWVFSHKGFYAGLDQEDSIWAAAIPTDAAWNEAYDRIAPYYNYSQAYVDKEDEDALTTSTAVPKYFVDDPDSLSELSRRMDIASGDIFNVRLQPRKFNGFWTEELFLDATELPRMFNTRRDTFQIGDGKSGDVRDWIFQGLQPEKISNGLVYPVSHWGLMDSLSVFDMEIEANGRAVFQASNLTTATLRPITFNNAASALVNDSLLGLVTENNFSYVSNGTSKPTISFSLIDTKEGRQVVSGLEYEIFVVMVPDFYRINPDSIEGKAFKNKLRAKIKYNAGNAPAGGKVTEKETGNMDFTYSGERVDTIKIGTFTFPYSYKNITRSYPTISLTSNASNNDVSAKGGYQHPFNIDRIILRPKRDKDK